MTNQPPNGGEHEERVDEQELNRLLGLLGHPLMALQESDKKPLENVLRSLRKALAAANERITKLEKHGKTLVAANTKHFNAARGANERAEAAEKANVELELGNDSWRIGHGKLTAKYSALRDVARPHGDENLGIAVEEWEALNEGDSSPASDSEAHEGAVGKPPGAPASEPEATAEAQPCPECGEPDCRRSACKRKQIQRKESDDGANHES